MARKKKIILEPVSKLGFDENLRMCYNCMFWNRQSGRCPWSKENYDYNHFCNSQSLFRYRLEYKHWINDTF